MNAIPETHVYDVEDNPQFSLDGERITFVFVGQRGSRIPLTIDRSAFAKFVSRLTRAQLMADSIAEQRDAPSPTVAVGVAQAKAVAPYGEGYVVMTVVTPLPMMQQFGLSPELAEGLAEQLRKGAEDARKNSVDPRH